MVEFSEPLLNESVGLQLDCDFNSASSSESSRISETGTRQLDTTAGLNSLSASLSQPSMTTSSLTRSGDTPAESRCSGCGEPIIDRFYLFALERQWHNSCLRCSLCGMQLEEQGSCYVKDGMIYCKDDYLRRFGIQKCSRCSVLIQSGEMVMKAQTNVYHVNCFTCSICSSLLQTGDHFGIFENKIFCRHHYEQLQFNMINTLVTNSSSQITCNSTAISTARNASNSIPPFTDTAVPQSTTTSCLEAMHLSSTNPVTTVTDLVSFPQVIPPPSQEYQSNQTSFEQQPPAKSRTMNNKKKRQSHDTGQPWSMGITIMEPESGYPGQPPLKQKRMRTSFKHHQLRIMKQYFNLNHNPDAKDLKQLSQKTGLSKRVLQVWFQNARAKFRRGLGSKEGSLNEGGDNSPTGEGHNSDELPSDSDSHDFNETDSSGNCVISNSLDHHSLELSPDDKEKQTSQKIVVTATIDDVLNNGISLTHTEPLELLAN